MSILGLLLDWSWPAVGLVYVYSKALQMSGHISARTEYALMMCGDAVMILRQLRQVVETGPSLAFTVGGFAFFLWWDYRQWRKYRDDDDDDLGKRLRSWARSHIPRPELIRIRPIEQVTG